MITTWLSQHLSIFVSQSIIYIIIYIFISTGFSRPDRLFSQILLLRRSKRCCSLPWRSALPRAARFSEVKSGVPPRHRSSRWLEDNRGKFIVKEMDRPIIYALHEPSVWGGWKITIFHRRYIFMSWFLFHSHSFVKFWWKFQRLTHFQWISCFSNSRKQWIQTRWAPSSYTPTTRVIRTVSHP